MGLLMIFTSHKIMRPNFTLVSVYYLCNSITQILHVHSFELPVSSTSCPSTHQKYWQPMIFPIFSFIISCSIHFFPSKHKVLHFNPNSLHKDSSTLLPFLNLLPAFTSHFLIHTEYFSHCSVAIMKHHNQSNL